MSLRTIDAIALGLAINIQSGIHCFSLLLGRVLQRAWKNVIIYKMLVNVIKRMNYIGKKQKAIKGLQFGYRQNKLDCTISIGVECDLLNDTNHDNVHYNI